MDAARETNGHIGRQELDLRLTVFLMVAEPGRRYSQTEIAAACGCSRALIWQIEQRALAKLRRAAKRRKLREAA